MLNTSQSHSYFPIFLNNKIVISPSPTTQNLGLLFEPTISFTPHITAITKSANDHIYRIRIIRKSITIYLQKTLVNAFILSRIDYCSSLLTNLPVPHLYPT